MRNLARALFVEQPSNMPAVSKKLATITVPKDPSTEDEHLTGVNPSTSKCVQPHAPPAVAKAAQAEKVKKNSFFFPSFFPSLQKIFKGAHVFFPFCLCTRVYKRVPIFSPCCHRSIASTHCALPIRTSIRVLLDPVPTAC